MLGQFNLRNKNFFKNNSLILQNLSYITLLELFVVISPLITYPYLIKTLGMKLYGFVIIAQVIVSYAVILINFGFRRISAKDISIYRDDKNKLSEILSSIFTIRAIICFITFIIYFIVISIIPQYNEHLMLFIFSFGLTFNELLFPQFYFQGIEKMKYITIINLTINTIFIFLIFIFIKEESDYFYVPLFKSIGFIIGGLYSLFIIFYFHKIKFKRPKLSVIKFYINDALPILSTELITTIKDKFGYILISTFIGVNELVIYDLGSKFTNILVKPVNIFSKVILPKIAKEKNVTLLKKTTVGSFICMVLIIITFNLNLPFAVDFFLSKKVDLLPFRIFSIAPLFLALSSFLASSGIIAFGYNKYIFHSIVITTVVYLSCLAIFYFENALNTVLAFIIITVIAYMAEFIYRIVIVNKIINYVSK